MRKFIAVMAGAPMAPPETWDAYAAGFAAGELAERNRCRWPDCTENADMICERFTAGTCAGPSTEFMP